MDLITSWFADPWNTGFILLCIFIDSVIIIDSDD